MQSLREFLEYKIFVRKRFLCLTGQLVAPSVARSAGPPVVVPILNDRECLHECLTLNKALTD